MDHFTSVDTINASNFVRAVIQPDGMGAIHFLMPVTDFEYNGQPVTPPGFDKEYGLYLTLDGTNIGHPDGSVDFTSLNVTLWADPGNDAGTPSVSETSDPAFTNGTANDIVLATGTLVSGSMSLDPTTNTRHADLVEQLTPTLDGTVTPRWLHQARNPAGRTNNRAAYGSAFHLLPSFHGRWPDHHNGERWNSADHARPSGNHPAPEYLTQPPATR